MTIDTSGFYRTADDTLIHAPNAVKAPTYSLLRADKDTYTYPVQGWRWFDSKEAAEEFFEITPDGVEPVLVRARNADGTFIADDPATLDVNEAWVLATDD